MDLIKKDIAAGEKHIYKRDGELKAAFDALPADQQKLLERTAARIKVLFFFLFF